MKIHSGFISNSSSSSYICEFCYTCELCCREEKGQDWDPINDAQMIEYEYNKLMCYNHIPQETVVRYIQILCSKHLSETTKDELSLVEYLDILHTNIFQKNLKSLSPNDDYFRPYYLKVINWINKYHILPEFLSPYYNLNIIDDLDILNYILVKYNIDKNSISDEIKSTFKSLKELKEYR